jgi:hypothetical protein
MKVVVECMKGRDRKKREVECIERKEITEEEFMKKGEMDCMKERER